MLRIVVIIIMYVISFVSYAQNSNVSEINSDKEKNYQVNVIINNIISNNGKVYFALYDSKENFYQKKPVKSIVAEINNGISKASFDFLNPNTYAIVCFHDANNNGKLDFETNGMPIEDYGVSNNVLNFGPPQFKDVKFEISDKDLTFEIKF